MSHPSGYALCFVRDLLTLGIASVLALTGLPTAFGQETSPAAPPPDTVAPDEITDLTATALDKATIKIEWTAPADQTPQGRAKAESYEIRYYTEMDAQRGDKQGRVLAGPTPAAPGTKQSATARNLDEDVEHYFFVLAIDKAGNKQRSNVTLARTPDQTPPGKIADLAAVAADKSTVKLTWTAPEDPTGKKAERYELYYKQGTVSAANQSGATKVDISTAKKAGQAESHTVSGLEEKKSYSFLLKAFDKAGNATFGNIATAKTPDQTPPAAISDLRAEPQNKSTVKLIWTAPADAPGEAVAGYEVFHHTKEITQQTANRGTKVPMSGAKAPGQTENKLLTGLLENQSYWFLVRALDQAGNESFSSVQQATTPDETPPEAVSDFTAEPRPEGGALAIQWKAPADRDLKGIVLRIKAGTRPQTPQEGEPVCDTAGNPACDTKTSHVFAWLGKRQAVLRDGVSLRWRSQLQQGKDRRRSPEGHATARETPRRAGFRQTKRGNRGHVAQPDRRGFLGNQDPAPGRSGGGKRERPHRENRVPRTGHHDGVQRHRSPLGRDAPLRRVCLRHGPQCQQTRQG